MTRNEVEDLLRFLGMEYPSLKLSKEKIDVWFNELQQYDCEDVKNKIKELMSNERYAFSLPPLETIIAGLTKKNKKVNFKDIVYFCKYCNRGFNNRDELDKHEDRCRSIRYIVRQYEKYNLGIVDKKTLYNMSDEDFNKRYEKLLKIVQQRTDDVGERTRIDFIFNPPSYEKAKRFLGN